MKSAALPTYRVAESLLVPCARPPSSPGVFADSPARAVMTDLLEVAAATISPNATISEAEAKMIHRGVRMLIVQDDTNCAAGVIGARDLYGERALCVQNEKKVVRSELKVADVMTTLSNLDAINLKSLSGATVADVVATFDQTGRRHLLVIEPSETDVSGRVRGVISLAQVERQLGTTISPAGIANTFVEIARALA